MAQGWSIIDKTPSTAQSASINSSTGVANFPANPSTTTDNVYTIQYDNGNGCTETTTYTVEKCVPSCTCTASAGGNVQCEASTSLVSVGSYTSNNCSGSWSATHKSGANFLYDFSFSNGTISAKVQQGSTTSTQSGTYTIGIDNCTHDVTFTQEKCTPVCNTVHYVTAGYPDGCTFSCNGQTSTSSNDSFTIPSGSAGATITVSCPSSKVAITSSFYVRCGEYCTFEIYQIIPIDVYGEVGTTGWATIHVEGAEEEIPTVDVEFSAEYRCTAEGSDRDYYGYATVIDGEWREHLESRCSDGSAAWYELSFVIESATFPETGTNERFDSGSYTCFRIS